MSATEVTLGGRRSGHELRRRIAGIVFAVMAGAATLVGVVALVVLLGDEYEERTGHERLGYTRQELVLGLSYSFPLGIQVYGEGAYAYDTLKRAGSGLTNVVRVPVSGGSAPPSPPDV